MQYLYCQWWKKTHYSYTLQWDTGKLTVVTHLFRYCIEKHTLYFCIYVLIQDEIGTNVISIAIWLQLLKTSYIAENGAQLKTKTP